MAYFDVLIGKRMESIKNDMVQMKAGESIQHAYLKGRYDEAVQIREDLKARSNVDRDEDGI